MNSPYYSARSDKHVGKISWINRDSGDAVIMLESGAEDVFLPAAVLKNSGFRPEDIFVGVTISGYFGRNKTGTLQVTRVEHIDSSRIVLQVAPDPLVNVNLPDLPSQGPGPHFEINDSGVIDFAGPEALDREGNNVGRLQRLHPILRDLSHNLNDSFGKGNIPHPHLASRINEYHR